MKREGEFEDGTSPTEAREISEMYKGSKINEIKKSVR